MKAPMSNQHRRYSLPGPPAAGRAWPGPFPPHPTLSVLAVEELGKAIREGATVRDYYAVAAVFGVSRRDATGFWERRHQLQTL
jgi:hypothetical protein